MSRGSTSSCEDVIDEGEEKFHPFIQAELETLNLASQSVNTFEARLEESRILFIDINKERTAKLDEIVKRTGKCIEKARPFYEAKARQKALQTDVQRAAQMYERACSTAEAAKEMVQLAEQSVLNIGTLDGNWQEVLNHATERVLKAERDKADSERIHQIHAEELSKVAQYCVNLERAVKNCITKSAAYFEALQLYNEKLEVKKVEIRELESSLNTAKHTYSLALSTLENISNIIHKRRQVLRENKLHQDESGSDGDAKTDPLLLDVPDLIRQLSVSTASPPSDSTQPPDTSSITPSVPNLLIQSTAQTTTTVSCPVAPDSPRKASLPTRSLPLKSNASIRAGVVMNPLDLLRSVGLDDLAKALPQRQGQLQAKPKTQPHLRPSTAKGLTSSTSSYSLKAQTPSKSSPISLPRSRGSVSKTDKPQTLSNSDASKSLKMTNHVAPATVVSCPSPSLSEASTGSSNTGSHRRMFLSHDHSGRSSEAEDNAPSDASTVKMAVSSTMSVTPVSLETAALNSSPQMEGEQQTNAT